jgi:hypothetical protein
MATRGPAVIVRQTQCASCHRVVELVCRTRSGFWGYPEYHEYLCPGCGKRNHALVPGTVLEARIPAPSESPAVRRAGRV